MDRKFVSLGFRFAGLLALAAGLLPTVKGQPANLTFCIFGALFLVMAIITRRRTGGPTSG